MSWPERWVRSVGEVRPRLLVVGGASLDIIHVRGVPTPTPGGAGLYTALAAARAGADVTMLAPVPHPMPPELAPALERIRWVGPAVTADELPRFEIAYDDHGAVTLFREHLGAEPDMTPALLDLVDELPGCAYCVPFLDARLQHAFITALHDRGVLTVAATYGMAARRETDVVRRTAAVADLFFCNADEAGVLFGDDHAAAPPSAGRLRFVTRGAAGATVLQGAHHTEVTGLRVDALDPTGAGDTFCGTTVARLLAGDHPVIAAERGNAAAAEMVTQIGPAALWAPTPSPAPPADSRVRVDHGAVQRLGMLLRELPDLEGSPFVGPLFPPVGDPAAVDWWFAATLQQYGFWYERDGRYAGPMIARLDGVEHKGSDYLWAQYLRWWRRAPLAIGPHGQQAVDEAAWADAAADDAGVDPYPDPQQRASSCRQYGASMAELGMSPTELVAAAAATPRPMAALLRMLDHVGGYREDPFRKKAALLGVVLRQRPEGFLPAAADDDAPPIVDYHVQRTSLRTGMVVIDDPLLAAAVADRRVVTAVDEAAVRRATFDAVAGLTAASGRSMGAVDWFLFQMRRRCPEMTVPDCANCPADPACAKSTGQFQPVFRTTAY